MILKSLSRKSGTHQLLNYLFKDEKKLIRSKEKPIVIRHNIRSRSLDKWVKEFDKNEGYRLHRRKDNVNVYHTILSFSNKDKEHIDEKLIRDTAKQYMKLRGEKNLFIGTAHYNKDHVHLHLVMSGTKYLTGEANRLSRAEFHQLKISMDLWQQKKYPELVNSLPRHGRAKELKISPKEKQITSINRREPQKDKLLMTLEKTYTKSKSLDDFLRQLKKAGYEPYYRAGKLTGVKFEGGLKFRLSKLGYDKDKIEKLNVIHLKEEKQLAELRELREGRSKDREQNNEQEPRSSEKDMKDDDKEGRNQSEDIGRENQEENEMEQEIDDRDDMEL